MRRYAPKLAAAAALAAAAIVLRMTVLAPDAIPVRVVTVARGKVEQTVTNSRGGTVKARRRAKLSPEVGGRVVALPHPKGGHVRGGEPLLVLDDRIQKARLDVAERELAAAAAQCDQAAAAAERAEREAARARRLEGDGIVSADLLDQTESAARTSEASARAAAAGLERARSTLDLARREHSQTVLHAPFDGVVADISIQVGEWTTPSPPGLPMPPVIDVFDPSSIHVSAPMDEVDSARIREGQRARVTVDSYPGRTLPGRVVRVAPYVLDVQAQNRTVEIEVELDDEGFARSLLPGTSADVEVILSVHENVLRIPTTALLEGSKILVVEDTRLVERPVQLAIRNWDFSEVESGLAAGGQVVVSLDRPEVKAGARVRVVEAPKP